MNFRSEAKKFFGYVVLFVAAVIFLAPPTTYTQVAGATLIGTVSDPSGAVIPKASIAVKNEATGVVVNVTTNSAGLYSVPNLIPGMYDVTTSVRGFKTQTQTGIRLTVGATQTFPITLAVGQTTQKVTVSAAPPLVQLANSTLSATVNSTTVRELPLNGRDWTSLATLQPGITAIRTQASANSTSSRGNRGFGDQLTDAGHRPSENNYRLDGISINDYSNMSPGSVLGVTLGVDAIQEFSVLTTDYGAEYGRTSGAVINAITKSGTNAFHGDLYEFVRNKSFDARNFFEPNLLPFARNQFGASGGGPIRKDKTFIFGDYESIRQSRTVPFSNRVLTPAAKAGQLCSQPGTTGCTPTTVAIDPKVAPFLALWPACNGPTEPGGDFCVESGAGATSLDENFFTVRADQRFSDKDSLAGSYFFDNAPQTQADSYNIALNEIATRRQMASLEETHVFSPTLVNSLRLGWNRTVGLVNLPVSAINPLGDSTALGAAPGRFAPIITFPGIGAGMPGGLGAGSIFLHHGNSAQLYDDAFLTRGTHDVKFGFAYERIELNLSSKIRQNGSFSFPSLAGFLQDQPTLALLLNPAFSKEIAARDSLFGGYIQDDWHARSNLTVNLGLRYEYMTPPTDANNALQVVKNLYGGVPVPVNTLWQSTPSKDFEPRIGFSWDPFKTGKTAIRGGFGIFDAQGLPYTYGLGLSLSWPYAVQTASSLTAYPGSFPTGAYPILLGTLTPGNFKGLVVKYADQNPPRSYTMNWNINIQREIAANTTVMIGYVGSRGVHQSIGADEANVVLPQQTAAGLLWPFPVGSGTLLNPNTGQERPTFWYGNSSYHGLEASIIKRMGHGLQAQGSYTWGHCIDNGSAGAIGDTYLNAGSSMLWFAQAYRHGNCDFDIGQNFVANYVWDIPTPNFSSSAANWLAGGWEVGGVFSASTGSPFDAFVGGDPLGQKGDPWPFANRPIGCGTSSVANDATGVPSDFPHGDCFAPPVVPASFAALCQPAAVSTPNTCMNLMGNAGRNQLFGPGLLDFDFSLFKNMPVKRISENFNIQFRAEFFNVLNHTNFQSPLDNNYFLNQNGTPVSGAGELDATTTDARQIQFGLKVDW